MRTTLAPLSLLVLAGVAALTAASATARAAAPAATDRELVVLILVDAMRPDHIGAYGYGRPTTPSLDSFAKEATRYTRAYANAPWTRPSTTSFLTGLNASRHRTETAKSKLPADVVTIAERLRRAGFATSGFTANGNGGSLAGLQRGFDHFEDPTMTYTKDKRGKVYANNLPTGPFLVDRALAHLKSSKAKKEFVFLFLVDPHDPYEAAPELEKMFLGDFKGVVRRRAEWEHNNNYSADERFSMMAVYDAGIRQADQALGTFFAGLKELGVYDNATIFVSADHGEAFGEHGVYLHAHHFFEEIIRIPLLVRGAGFAPGAVSDRETQSLDVSASILERARADAAGLPGLPLVSAPPPDRAIISEYNEFGIHRQAIFDARYKVVWQRAADAAVFAQEVPGREFFPSVVFSGETVHAFDLASDPGEAKNLAPTLPARAAELLQKLREFVAASKSAATAKP